MFSKFRNRMQGMTNNNYQQPYNMMMEPPTYNQYDLSRIDEQLNELKRVNTELTRRISRLENYLGIRAESDASNYQ